MNTIQRRCMECGAQAVVPTAKPGRFTRYKALREIEIPADFEIPTCRECGTEWLDEDTVEALDRVLEDRYSRSLVERAQTAIDQLICQSVTQQRLEQVLGLSQGYISKIRAGKMPSEPLVASLMIFASEPALINKAERLWSAVPSKAG